MQKELTGWQRLLEDPTGILKDEKLVKKLIKHLETLKSDAIDNFRADKDSSIWKKDIVAINTAINIIGRAYNIENNEKKYLITNFENKTRIKILIDLHDWTEEEIEHARKSEVYRWLNEPHLYRLLDEDQLTDEEYQTILDEVNYD